ncbi:protein of unknown function [Micropruina glycogenica]|uniref:Uncharacterized protein n=1 Tax=Micropruina glycogenica TaxID=75385 RepID=A0A2N9JBL3_9ACTN|nr:protein of unknown function [Micropruina glycogenica]
MRSRVAPGTTVGFRHSRGRRTLIRTVRWNEVPGQARDDGRSRSFRRTTDSQPHRPLE